MQNRVSLKSIQWLEDELWTLTLTWAAEQKLTDTYLWRYVLAEGTARPCSSTRWPEEGTSEWTLEFTADVKKKRTFRIIGHKPKHHQHRGESQTLWVNHKTSWTSDGLERASGWTSAHREVQDSPYWRADTEAGWRSSDSGSWGTPPRAPWCRSDWTSADSPRWPEPCPVRTDKSSWDYVLKLGLIRVNKLHPAAAAAVSETCSNASCRLSGFQLFLSQRSEDPDPKMLQGDFLLVDCTLTPSPWGCCRGNNPRVTAVVTESWTPGCLFTPKLHTERLPTRSRSRSRSRYWWNKQEIHLFGQEQTGSRRNSLQPRLDSGWPV